MDPRPGPSLRDDKPSEQNDLTTTIAQWRAASRALDDDQLLTETQDQLANNGWGSFNSRYMRELRYEIEYRGLTDSEAYRTLVRRVIFLDRTIKVRHQAVPAPHSRRQLIRIRPGS
jgi:hypothetical protein